MNLNKEQYKAAVHVNGPMLVLAGPGSGKTYLAEKLSKQLGIPRYDLDELQWDNESDSYGTKREPLAIVLGRIGHSSGSPSLFT